MKKASLFLVLILVNVQVYAQGLNNTGYKSAITKAFHQYQNKQFKKAGLAFEEAFKLQEPKNVDLYNAGCSWALAGNKEKAFKYLTRAIDKHYSDFKHFTTDPDLSVLHSDKRWVELQNKVKANEKVQQVKYGDLTKRLTIILQDDQKYRVMVDSVSKRFGWESVEFRNLNKRIHQVDSVNVGSVTEIIDRYGWLGPEEVGEGANALFLVIQHANLATQEMYLPEMREAVKRGKALPQNLALLEDRVLLKQGKKQMYGSQVTTDPVTKKLIFSPIEDEPNVNRRRATVGLEPLEDYAKTFEMEYKLPIIGN